MQNWDTMQTTSVNYEQHNKWYNNLYTNASIKTEPGSESPSLEHQLRSPESNADILSHLESYSKQHSQASHQMSTMDLLSAMTPSPSNTDSMQHIFDGNIQQQLVQQQKYQQHFQQAQEAAAQHQATSSHLPLGFNPLTPPGLPTAVLPSISQFFHQQSHNTIQNGPQTPSPQPLKAHMVTPLNSNEKLQAALTPRNTPPMDITPPKSPKNQTTVEKCISLEKDQDAQSNSSDDIKYNGESEDDESIRLPIFNSHGKMKNYKCKSCGVISITKVNFWDHVRTHMKPEKILQCPKCPFVTELKHHLEYHLRKHKNLKPFQCDKCSYTCVNKSMLNSHRKSHSSVYQYRCSDCDYATKYCHSFKLHLRKYDHKPGLVLDEEGIPNPSVVIDVYGTRRGPKSKNSTAVSKRSNSTNSKNTNERSTAKLGQIPNNGTDYKACASQLTAALQSFSIPAHHHHHQMPVSPAKSPNTLSSDSPAVSHGSSQQNQQEHKPQQLQTVVQKQSLKSNQTGQNVQATTADSAITDMEAMTNIFPPLATIFQQNTNTMALFPYWNLNLQMLAAQQQAVVLAQMSPSSREKALRRLHNIHSNKSAYDPIDVNDEDEESDIDRKSTDSAMDLSQGSPLKDDADIQKTPAYLRLQDESSDTPTVSTNCAIKRKGRVLKLDAILQVKSSSQSPEGKESNDDQMANNNEQSPHVPIPSTSDTTTTQPEESLKECDEVMNNVVSTVKDTGTSSTASSSGNSSNSSATSSATTTNGPSALGAMYECKYCDIYFKDAVLYTIHMGYHSCDDVFKCNMCGEKCDGPVGLFVHMARNAHS
ncbi:protein hunchback [Ceratitis capitata]|uniref:protein hunchback n=1 Tax=Ceratitis capitata TaxID=7213 RepID=UPI000329AE7D|nr:protein hunchback [Ceratitis capitata]XP_004529178.1 protein hunchback [Ceratitis capitata]XP_004529179.1 protein hunchback [Ceratitis capitata]XP_012158577.1 protein hunchback [Ceratitis capitata]